MTRVTALLSATALIVGFASPAFSCGMNKSAKHGNQTMAEYTIQDEHADSEEAMTTFDPASVPAFEPKADGVEAPIEEAVE